ncbi:MAG: DNA primase [Veillonella sp.]|nr:DNA primase [Veillonella sp.]
MARYFGDELKQQIIDANDIVSVISEHISLKKRGQNYWACCPFHGEKSPSFSVRPDKGFYHCFGCGAGGNVITFLMNYEHLTFPEALEKLAHRANIPLPEEEMTPQQKAREAHRQRLYQVNQMAETFFHNCLLKTEMGKPGLDYLLKRGLTRETIERFKLGFAPDNWDKLYKSFLDHGVEEKVLLELNLIRKQDGKTYDFFRNRVMFPIHDGRGRTIGFGGRILDNNSQMAKYMNSPESPIFDKGKNLFAFDQAYKSIRQTKQAILVEGYMDVISAHNKGVTNVVASLGTAYTVDHGKLLMRQAEEIVLAYDMDGAGQKAAKRAIDLLQNTDFKVRVLAMPDGKDPDDYVRNHGADAFRKLVADAIKPFDYLLNEALIRHDTNTSDGKQAILQDMFPYIANDHNEVRRDDMLRALAMPLWLDNSTVFRYFRDYLKKGNVELQTERQAPVRERVASDDEDKLLMLMVDNADYLREALQYVLVEDFANPVHQDLIRTLVKVAEETGSLNGERLESELSEGARQEYSRLMVADRTGLSGDLLYKLVGAVRIKSLKNQYKLHSMQADQLNRAGDKGFLVELHKCQEIQKEIKTLQEAMKNL